MVLNGLQYILTSLLHLPGLIQVSRGIVMKSTFSLLSGDSGIEPKYTLTSTLDFLVSRSESPLTKLERGSWAGAWTALCRG